MKIISALLTVAALTVHASAVLAQTPAAPEPEKGAAIFGTICIACHGADGNSIIPTQASLAGQHPEYIVKQLTEFKSGKRQNAIMLPFASLLSDEDIRNVAAWVSSQKLTPMAPRDKDLVLLGEKIYRGGLPERQIAACMGCHLPDGAGIPSQYPHLAGQHPEYTEAQLITFRDGTRSNNDVMADVAAYLTDREIKALADYIAGLR